MAQVRQFQMHQDDPAAREAMVALIRRAKASVDLLSFIEQISGREGTKQGRSRGMGWCPACGEAQSPHSNRLTITDDLWHCKSCGEGGSVVDAAMKYYRVGKTEAARILLGESAETPRPDVRPPALRVVDPEGERRQRASLTAALQCIFKHGLSNEPGCVKYLREERGLRPSVIQEAFRRGLLRMLPSNPYRATAWLREHVGEGLLKESGLWKPDKKMPWIAFRPLVALIPGNVSAEFRLIHSPRPGEKKAIHYGPKSSPWMWDGEGDGRRNMAIVEGWIDMLSLVCMESRSSIMALPGAACWVHQVDTWFGPLKERPGSKVTSLLDPDTTGDINSSRLAEEFEKLGIPFRRKDLPLDGDVNDFLRRVWNPANPAKVDQ